METANVNKTVEVELPVKINLNGKLLLNSQRIELLHKIKETSSLNTAAKELSISYQNAWSLIDEMNKLSPQIIVVKHRGGRGGGGAMLTEYGLFIVKEYSYIEKEVQKFLKRLNVEINM